MPERPSVLFINRVFPPASGATGELLAELSLDLAHAGWHVTVVTGTCPHTRAAVPRHSNLRIERVAAWSGPGTGLVGRALSYAALYPALLLRAMQLPAPDLIVTKTDPPLQLMLGPLVARAKGAAALHWAQDLYPEVAEQLDIVRTDSRLSRLLRVASTRLLRRHDHIVAIGRCMRARLHARGIPDEQVTVIPNWPLDAIRSVPHEANPFRTQHGLTDQFVVMYSGNMGRAHTFDAILGAAALLEPQHPDISFLLVGDGVQRAALEQSVKRRGLQNVRFLPFQPVEKLSESLSAADLHLATMHEETVGLVVPSKVYGILAAGRPCLFLGPAGSEAARFIHEHACGSVLPLATPEEVAQAILQWRDDPARDEAGRRAHEAARCGRARSLAAFEQLFRRTIAQVNA